MAKEQGLIDNKRYDFLWVTDFPLLEFDEEENRYVACHHPFTSPRDEDIKLLETSPEKAKAKAYDIVLNGLEIGGGSIRIHDPKLQSKVFRAIGLMAGPERPPVTPPNIGCIRSTSTAIAGTELISVMAWAPSPCVAMTISLISDT